MAKKHSVPVFYDLGSGCLIDTTQYSLEYEPTVKDAISDGVDLVFFSGDKLIGGPQAGINPLEDFKPRPVPELSVERTLEGAVRLRWPVSADGFQLQSTPILGSGEWSPVLGQISVDDNQNPPQRYVIVMEPGDTAFFRLAK